MNKPRTQRQIIAEYEAKAYANYKDTNFYLFQLEYCAKWRAELLGWRQ